MLAPIPGVPVVPQPGIQSRKWEVGDSAWWDGEVITVIGPFVNTGIFNTEFVGIFNSATQVESFVPTDKLELEQITKRAITG